MSTGLTAHWRLETNKKLSRFRSRLADRRIQAKKERVESDARASLVGESIPEATVVVDMATGRFCEANSEAERLFKLSRKRLLEIGFAEVDRTAADEALPGAMKEQLQAAVDGQTPVFEWMLRAGDGGDLTCEVRLVRLGATEPPLIWASLTDQGKAHDVEKEPVSVDRDQEGMLRNLLRIADAAIANLTVEELLPELCDRLRDTLKADNCAILLAEPGGDLIVRAVSGFEPLGTRVPAGTGFSGRVAAGMNTLALHGDELEVVQTPVLRRLRCIVGAPLMIDERVVGVAHAGYFVDRELAPEQLDLLQLAADRAALAIKNARTYEQERTTAQALQQSLLPDTLPDIPHFELAAFYEPVGDRYQVGGDFYDVFAAGESRWVVVVGDVCGKGPEAAAVTAHARYSLRTEALHDPTPATMLTRLNNVLVAHGTDRRFLTLACATVDLTGDSIRVVLAVGGHPPPVLVRSDGSAHKIESSGTLVGVWEQVEFENVLVELEPNDMLVFYTDGLIEAYAPTRILEPNDVAHALASSPSRKLTDIIQKLEHDFLHESGDNPRDDVVILALRSAATAKNTQPSSADRNSAKTAGRFEKH